MLKRRALCIRRVSIGDFESKQKFKDILSTATEFTGDFSEFTCASEVCAEAAANFQDTKMSITIGSSGVDYSTPSAPVFKGAVGFGGRGVSIWTASDLSLVWDSGSMFEREQCAAYALTRGRAMAWPTRSSPRSARCTATAA